MRNKVRSQKYFPWSINSVCLFEIFWQRQEEEPTFSNLRPWFTTASLLSEKTSTNPEDNNKNFFHLQSVNTQSTQRATWTELKIINIK